MHGLVHDNFKTWTGTFGKLTDPQIDKLDTSEQQGQVGGWRRPTRLSERASERERERERAERARRERGYIHTCIHIRIYVYTYIYVVPYACIHMWVVYVAYKCVYVAYVCIWVSVDVYTCVGACLLNMCVYVCM